MLFLNIDNILMFTENGYEVPLNKTYTIEWEIIPNKQIEHLFISNPKGHILVDEDDFMPLFINDEKGKISVDQPVTIKFNDPDKTTIVYKPDYTSSTGDLVLSISNIKKLILLDESIPGGYNKPRVRRVVNGVVVEEPNTEDEHIYNTVRLTFNMLNETYVREYPIKVVINAINRIEYQTNEVQDGEDIKESTQYAYVSGEFRAAGSPDPNYNSIIDALIKTNFDEEQQKMLVTNVLYQGCVWQDKVSTDFVAANTLIFLNNLNDDYTRPTFYGNEESEDDVKYNFMFKFQKDSEMRFISSNTVADIIWDDIYIAENKPPRDPEPLHFSVGFTAELEGCYQNIMGMYIRKEYKKEVLLPDNPEETEIKIVHEDYLLGLITFFTEVEGEDERYRALLGNMGIPDPEKYPNIFKEQDPEEEGIDWTLINKKSKELMLTYDNIFPYAGTYKALLGAIKFLGYYDLIFKEWYKIKDKTGRDKFITLQAYDLQKGESLQTKLKRINVTYGEFEKYKKLNRLTMIYHLNQIDNEGSEELLYWDSSTVQRSGYKRQKDPTGETERYGWFRRNATDNQYYKIPVTYPIYLYRTDEILAKLWSVKEWLEKYILGVNCYISDICGEGIILERLKTQAYVTEHYIQDFTSEGKFTPKIVAHEPFNESYSLMTCTLNEFDNLTFEDYEDFNIEKFIMNISTNGDSSIYISPPIETWVAANEYQFRLQCSNVNSGTLAEFTDSSYIKNPLLIRDNKLLFYDNISRETKIQKDELPLIEIRKANIRNCHGNWKSNVQFTINTVIDQYTGKEYYVFKNFGAEAEDYRGLQKIFLAPIPAQTTSNQIFGAAISLDDDTDGNYFGLKSELIYTAENKWNIPLLIIRNYLVRNTNQVLKGDYILEILEGRIIFRNKHPEQGLIYSSNNEESLKSGKAVGADIKFGYYYDLEQGEQEIDIDYTYLSDRVPIYYFDWNKFTSGPSDKWTNQDFISQCVNTNKFVDVPVNRLGDYTVQVNAFDSYNNIFVNNSDDITTIESEPIPLDIILNQEFVWNDKDFYEKSYYGDLIDTSETETMFNEINKRSSYPQYPQNWRIYDIDPVLDSVNTIKYDSISYAMDIPETGDFIIFNNFTERALNIMSTTSELPSGYSAFNVSLCDENPNPQILLNSSYVGLCVYDNLSKEIIEDIYPLYVTKTYIPQTDFTEPEYMDYTYNRSYIKVEAELDSSQQAALIDLVNKNVLYRNNNILGYIYSANELILDVSDISVNYDGHYTLVTDSAQHFVENQVIKICYASEKEIHNHYTQNAIDNEYVLRVTDISTAVDGSIIYTLNGVIDLYKLNNKLYHNKAEHTLNEDHIGALLTSYPYIIKMCPAHLKAAQYILRVSDMGQESIAYYNGTEMNEITVQYEHLPLLFNEYLDTTYSAAIYSYDPYMLRNIYADTSVIYTEEDEFYKYRNKPVTIKKGRTVILKPQFNSSIFSKGFAEQNSENGIINIPWRIDWDWKSYIIDDLENCPDLYLDLVNKQTIFKSCNPLLTVRPKLLGTQSPSMTVTDIYGNALTNPADGFIYVDQNEDDIYNRGEEETRNIYYKDVYIIGFDQQVGMRYTMSADGETITVTNNETGSDDSGNTQQLEISYKIYYNDGTVLENEGANIQLLSQTGKKARGNKVNITVPPAEFPHKEQVRQINGMFIIKNTNPRDLISAQQTFDADVYQYGYSKTVQIYNFMFDTIDLPADGIEELQEYIIRDLVTNVSYTLKRSEGEIEEINADTLSEANLIISNYRLLSNKQGNVNSVEPNYSGRKLYGQLLLVVDFYVNGVKNTIRTTGYSNIYQE